MRKQLGFLDTEEDLVDVGDDGDGLEWESRKDPDLPMVTHEGGAMGVSSPVHLPA
jgi:hypothetical protein